LHISKKSSNFAAQNKYRKQRAYEKMARLVRGVRYECTSSCQTAHAIAQPVKKYVDLVTFLTGKMRKCIQFVKKCTFFLTFRQNVTEKLAGVKKKQYFCRRIGL